jgi:hypothetical protein
MANFDGMESICSFLRTSLTQGTGKFPGVIEQINVNFMADQKCGERK